jgi:hypothetical protein
MRSRPETEMTFIGMLKSIQRPVSSIGNAPPQHLSYENCRAKFQKFQIFSDPTAGFMQVFCQPAVATSDVINIRAVRNR